MTPPTAAATKCFCCDFLASGYRTERKMGCGCGYATRAPRQSPVRPPIPIPATHVCVLGVSGWRRLARTPPRDSTVSKGLFGPPRARQVFIQSLDTWREISKTNGRKNNPRLGINRFGLGERSSKPEVSKFHCERAFRAAVLVFWAERCQCRAGRHVDLSIPLPPPIHHSVRREKWDCPSGTRSRAPPSSPPRPLHIHLCHLLHFIVALFPGACASSGRRHLVGAHSLGRRSGRSITARLHRHCPRKEGCQSHGISRTSSHFARAGCGPGPCPRHWAASLSVMPMPVEILETFGLDSNVTTFSSGLTT